MIALAFSSDDKSNIRKVPGSKTKITSQTGSFVGPKNTRPPFRYRACGNRVVSAGNSFKIDNEAMLKLPGSKSFSCPKKIPNLEKKNTKTTPSDSKKQLSRGESKERGQTESNITSDEQSIPPSSTSQPLRAPSKRSMIPVRTPSKTLVLQSNKQAPTYNQESENRREQTLVSPLPKATLSLENDNTYDLNPQLSSGVSVDSKLSSSSSVIYSESTGNTDVCDDDLSAITTVTVESEISCSRELLRDISFSSQDSSNHSINTGIDESDSPLTDEETDDSVKIRIIIRKKPSQNEKGFPSRNPIQFQSCVKVPESELSVETGLTTETSPHDGVDSIEVISPSVAHIENEGKVSTTSNVSSNIDKSDTQIFTYSEEQMDDDLINSIESPNSIKVSVVPVSINRKPSRTGEIYYNSLPDRIWKEYQRCEKDDGHIKILDFGILSGLLCVSGKIIGLRQTPYEGQQYRFQIVFPKEYPHKAPLVNFLDPIDHSSVSGEDYSVNVKSLVGNRRRIKDFGWDFSINFDEIMRRVCDRIFNPKVRPGKKRKIDCTDYEIRSVRPKNLQAVIN